MRSCELACSLLAARRYFAIVLLALGSTAPVGAQAPGPAAPTPSSAAPNGLLTSLERDRHDHYSARAQAGAIELVFFGTTATEMWSWAERGRSVWERAFGSLQAANFGSQGTHFESLLWRMRNGELDGYRAKLVVLQFGPGDSAIADRFSTRGAEFVAGYSAVIAEIRARQPQAAVLLLAAFPRGKRRLEPWREVAAANAAIYAQLADDATVFYADIGERFFLPDGSFDHDLWGTPGPAGVGIQPPAFGVWAEGLQPWLDRFVR
jgi:hypothetical protein